MGVIGGGVDGYRGRYSCVRGGLAEYQSQCGASLRGSIRGTVNDGYFVGVKLKC